MDELIASVPRLDRRVQATGEQFLNVASGQVTMEQWLGLARKINETFKADKGWPASWSRAAPTRSKNWPISFT
jgi:L-asparaginase/Glu-tRNA(Gln) amidotransferase subunit D